MQDKFADLQTFVEVVRAKRLGLAADRMGIARSAVSRRIRELEERLGAKLLSRTTRQFSLTEVGERFYERSLQLLAELEQAEEMARNQMVDPVGALRIIGPMSFGILHLAPVISEFLKENQQLTVELNLDDRLVDIVAEGYDLAIRISHLKDSNIVARRLALIRCAVVGSPEYFKRNGIPKNPSDLLQHRGIGYSNMSDRVYWRFGIRGSKKMLPVEVPTALRVNNGDAMREAAVAGYGLANLPTFIVHREVAAGRLLRVLGDYEPTPFWMYAVRPSGHLVAAKVRRFIDFMVSQFGSDPYWDADVFNLPD